MYSDRRVIPLWVIPLLQEIGVAEANGEVRFLTGSSCRAVGTSEWVEFNAPLDTIQVISEEPGSLNIGRLHNRWIQCNYWFHKKSRFEHTHIFMDASATGRLEWCTTVCSLVFIAISLFLFIIFVNVVLSQRWGVVCGLRLFKCL